MHDRPARLSRVKYIFVLLLSISGRSVKIMKRRKSLKQREKIAIILIYDRCRQLKTKLQTRLHQLMKNKGIWVPQCVPLSYLYLRNIRRLNTSLCFTQNGYCGKVKKSVKKYYWTLTLIFLPCVNVLIISKLILFNTKRWREKR